MVLGYPGPLSFASASPVPVSPELITFPRNG